ncbi:DNA cytosine methyltransferase [Nocardia sp. ET3-3]|uniref:DNA (cytosine-5-)-methyltransferase n=1 Tax=Nocardia terrae TaxID=2675851 RepID=A0A7K1UQM0_9NOCA|nr:DNA cytosine methyltransferase [Nocardia terrae]MVU76449.1 DNA cytosine methyltransferase [Nocardia terrae]
MADESTGECLFHNAELPSEVEMIDLFAGPGGLDVAARWLGIKAVGIEHDRDACLTRIDAKLGTRQADVRSLELLDIFPNARILTGGPPCQTYSVAGSGVGRKALDQVVRFMSRMADGEDIEAELESLEDDRTGLVLQPLRWALAAIEKGRPFETIVLEQVPTVLPVWEALATALLKHRYDVRVGIVHTEEFGVPQTRRRAILIACRDRAAHFPKPTHHRYRKGVPRGQGEADRLPWTTMSEALPNRSYEFHVVSNYGTGGDPKLRGRRGSNEPSATVTGKVRRNRIVSKGADQDRLEPKEAGRLQTFPIDYPWAGLDQYQQVGNAVPPRVGAHILAAAVFGEKPEETSLDQAVGGLWESALSGKHDLKREPLPQPDEVDGLFDEHGRPYRVDLDSISAYSA